MHTVTALARRFKLSRSTLLYYDRIGLLHPRRHAANGYRLYADEDARRLERICLYREAGVSLEQIARLLADEPIHATKAALANHLQSLALQIHALREQQARVVRLLLLDSLDARPRILDRDQLVAMLRRAGFADDDLYRLHALFEQSNPRDHQDFLERLGLEPAEIRQIRLAAGDARAQPAPQR